MKRAILILIVVAGCAVQTGPERTEVDHVVGHPPETASERAMVSRAAAALARFEQTDDLTASTSNLDLCSRDSESTSCCYNDGLSWCCCFVDVRDGRHFCDCGTMPIPPITTDPGHGGTSTP